MRRAAIPLLVISLLGDCMYAQLPKIRGYYLNVPTWSDSNLVVAGGLANINRFRLMTEPSHGELSLQVAYEQVLSLSQRGSSAPSGLFAGFVSGGGEWLPLQWTIESDDHSTWAHRFDRLNVGWAPGDAVEMRAGRLTASWATTVFLTPADPFLPFDPSDPFRVYRGGVDAFRFQYFPGPLSDVDFIVRPAEFSSGVAWSALARGRTVWRSWEVSAWAGMLYDEPAAAIGAAGGIGAVAVRGELTVQENEGSMALRGTIGIDGRFGVWKRDLFYVVEYQRDGFGAGNRSELLQVIQSDVFGRGQLQVLGRDEIVLQGLYQLHPLWAVSLLFMTNLNDPSSLLSPSVSYSIGDEMTGSGGIFFGFGEDTPTVESPIPSEYGLVPAYVYLSLTVFF
ncbi:MAG: hypothetical protein JSW51_07515 [Gemmatimonadota bacterium]|nr:MAG: hypothetical protein JSW51_07515 [Gemmatimonadota bacterium]